MHRGRNINRGLESFFREAFDGLKDTPGVDAWLVKGQGKKADREIPVWCLPRTGKIAKWVGKLIGRNGYIVEQLSSLLPVARQIHRLRPQVIFYSDANLGFQLYFQRQRIGVPYRLLFSNGGPLPPPILRTDFVHQVAPYYLDEALACGEQPDRQFMVPYGIEVPAAPKGEPAVKCAIRHQLQLPLDRPIILSVGAINRYHKRMDYLVKEVARLPKPRPYLQILGAWDDEAPSVINLAEALLGKGNYSARSVPYEQVADFYRAADVFVLSSLKEGFGRVYLEALMHGLPVIAHRHPVMEYVLDNQGLIGDLNRSDELAKLLAQELRRPQNREVCLQRWESVRNRFSWRELAPAYLKMFLSVAFQEVG